MHVRIDFELEDAAGRGRFRHFVEDAADLVASYGGSMSGEHGDGRARSELLPRMYSGEAIALMQQAKRILDPGNLLNPGVLVDPAPFDSDLRLAAAMQPVRTTLRLTHDSGSFADAVHRCTGVGKCVADNTGSGGVMCPSYLATRDEKDSTRGRAHVLQDVASGWSSGSTTPQWLTPSTCACPARDVRATAPRASTWRRTSRRPCPRSTAGSSPPLALRPRPAPEVGQVHAAAPRQRDAAQQALARVAKSAAGVDQRRSLPRFSERRLRRSGEFQKLDGARSSTPHGRPDVWVWADSFTDRFAADTGRAALELLESMGLRAAVIPEHACCGSPGPPPASSTRPDGSWARRSPRCTVTSPAGRP